MTRRFTYMILTAGLSALIGGLTLSAQKNSVEVATIPFAFQAQGRLLPAGEYRVQQTNDSGIFQLYNAQGSSTFVSAPLRDTGAAGNPRLTFHCYGNERLLSQIWTVDGNSYSTGDTSHEKKLRRNVEMSALISVKLTSR